MWSIDLQSASNDISVDVMSDYLQSLRCYFILGGGNPKNGAFNFTLCFFSVVSVDERKW